MNLLHPILTLRRDLRHQHHVAMDGSGLCPKLCPTRLGPSESVQDFEDVFNQESFDSLLVLRLWDHTIELVPDAKPANCKVYPISPLEQRELNAFIEEGLSTGQIRPSKSPMASLVFFIKKKDGSLQFVQDYQALNAMTVKNWYPLPLINELINRLKGAWFFMKLNV